ncbi:branched-chain amino acid ABC transporter substrate-binding protein [Halobacteriales archaeon QH_2_65_14]|nr:MAG: branched-chain amino acid ABC transporter substrate-binding protein [Halobacteriales archaeon QH_2_65_14]
MDREKLSRRRVLGTLGASGVIALAGCVGDDDDGGDDGDDGSGDSDTDDSDSDSDTGDSDSETGDSDSDSDSDTGDDDSDDGGMTDDVSGSFTIGILQDYTGPLDVYGHQGTSGFYSGLAHKADDDPLGENAIDEGGYEYSVGNIDLELLARDTQFDPSQAQQLAEDLVADDDVDLLYGAVSSDSAIRIISQVVDRTDVPFIAGPAAAAEITADGETCRDRVFRANENTAMDARSGGVYIAESTDVDQVALFGSDNSFGRSVVNNYKQVLEARGVEIVFEREVPEGQEEWSGLLNQAEEAGAQGMVGGFTASTLIPFGTAFLQGDYQMRLFGGFASRLTLGAVGGLLADALGDNFTNEGIEQAQFGPFTTRYHWNQYDNDINDAFVESHVEAYNVVPDLFTGGAFTASSAVIQAFHEQGEVSSDALIEGMSGMTVTDTPKGENGYEFQEYNNQARSDMTVAPVEVTPEDQEAWPAPIMPGEPIETIDADNVTIPADEMSCDLS